MHVSTFNRGPPENQIASTAVVSSNIRLLLGNCLKFEAWPPIPTN